MYFEKPMHSAKTMLKQTLHPLQQQDFTVQGVKSRKTLFQKQHDQWNKCINTPESNGAILEQSHFFSYEKVVM